MIQIKHNQNEYYLVKDKNKQYQFFSIKYENLKGDETIFCFMFV